MLSLHVTAATMLHAPELALEKKEAERLVLAWQQIFEVFGVPEVSEKTAAIMELGGVCAGVYIPRVIAIQIRRRKNRPQLVTPFPAPSGATPAQPQNQRVPEKKPNGTAPVPGVVPGFEALNLTPQESVTQ